MKVFNKSGNVWTNYPYILWVLWSFCKFPVKLIQWLTPWTLYYLVSAMWSCFLISCTHKDGLAESNIQAIWHNKVVNRSELIFKNLSWFLVIGCTILAFVSGFKLDWTKDMYGNVCLDWHWVIPFAIGLGFPILLIFGIGLFLLVESLEDP